MISASLMTRHDSASAPTGCNRNSRDNQRSRLYKAETILMPLGQDVSTPFGYQERLQTVLRSDFFQTNFLRTTLEPIHCQFRLNKTGASANYWRILTGQRCMVECFLLHELSHIIVRREYNTYYFYTPDGEALSPDAIAMDRFYNERQYWYEHWIVGHGPEFAETYLALVREFMGARAYLILRNSFDKYGVAYVPPRSIRKFPIQFTQHEDHELAELAA